MLHSEERMTLLAISLSRWELYWVADTDLEYISKVKMVVDLILGKKSIVSEYVIVISYVLEWIEMDYVI